MSLGVLYFYLPSLAILPKRWMTAKQLMTGCDPAQLLLTNPPASVHSRRNSALTISAPVLTYPVLPSQQLQEGIEVVVDRLKAAPDVPEAPVGIGLLCVRAGVTLCQATPQAQPQNQGAGGQLHPAAG